MPPSTSPHVNIVPVMHWLKSDTSRQPRMVSLLRFVNGEQSAHHSHSTLSHDEGCGVNMVLSQVSIAWLAQRVTAGQRVTRNRLPLGIADYARQEFWHEHYRCVPPHEGF